MTVYIERTNKRIRITKKCKASEILARFSINPQTVIIVRNNEIILPDDTINPKDDVKLLSVISGG